MHGHMVGHRAYSTQINNLPGLGGGEQETIEVAAWFVFEESFYLFNLKSSRAPY